MKKILIILLFLLLLIPYEVNAYGDLRCFGALNSNDEKILKPGDIITVNMGVSGYSDTQYISDANFTFYYEKAIFKLVRDKDNNYLKVMNGWDTYKNTVVNGENGDAVLSFAIGTNNKDKYFFDTRDSLIFAKVQLQVRDTAEDGYTSIRIFDKDSIYTTFVLDEDDLPDEVYDVNCSTSSISVNIKAPEKDSNTSLKSLKITNATLSPKFDPNTKYYSIDVPYSTEQVYIAGTCAGYKCTLKGNGTRTLKEGENNYEITVTAEDGTVAIYSIRINREQKEKVYAYLKSIEIEGHNLEPRFKSNTLVYTISLPKDTYTLKIYAICEADKCNIEGDGLVTLKEEDKTISLIVKTEDDTKTYTFNIERENPISGLDPEDKGNSGFTTFLWAIFILMLCGAGFYFYKKSGINIKVSKEDKKKNSNGNIDNSWRFK